MSQTFSLVCHETKQAIWIGQGHGSMGSLYYGEVHTMENLKRFLNEHRGKSLEFLCDDIADLDGYRTWEDLAIPDLEFACDHGNRDGDGDCMDCGATLSEQDS